MATGTKFYVDPGKAPVFGTLLYVDIAKGTRGAGRQIRITGHFDGIGEGHTYLPTPVLDQLFHLQLARLTGQPDRMGEPRIEVTNKSQRVGLSAVELPAVNGGKASRRTLVALDGGTWPTLETLGQIPRVELPAATGGAAVQPGGAVTPGATAAPGAPATAAPAASAAGPGMPAAQSTYKPQAPMTRKEAAVVLPRVENTAKHALSMAVRLMMGEFQCAVTDLDQQAVVRFANGLLMRFKDLGLEVPPKPEAKAPASSAPPAAKPTAAKPAPERKAEPVRTSAPITGGPVRPADEPPFEEPVDDGFGGDDDLPF